MIRLSDKHGVNPSMGLCYFCGEEDGTVVLAGRLRDDAEAPRAAVWTREPCPKCKDWMQRGVMLILIRDGWSGREEPDRLGSLVVITEEAARLAINEGPMQDRVLRERWAFVPETVWTQLGLPRRDKEKQ